MMAVTVGPVFGWRMFGKFPFTFDDFLGIRGNGFSSHLPLFFSNERSLIELTKTIFDVRQRKG